eukprot:CAMPEP_0204130870 /NCGR_PEP_ID=MMETSP0361-20130328/13610_1 /ASSEMBLY_ACC=CAM_ASM_000343 /TAXON_ID=268821 /ORGANISM="Scrippsiella Hangoei, Strain SHTV-5" /LENGTH=71 /DNA_ID=CAMNT_0051083521 /DNA_START=64 /DNA_END=279 /DNA_ORIENTATION=-
MKHEAHIEGPAQPSAAAAAATHRHPIKEVQRHRFAKKTRHHLTAVVPSVDPGWQWHLRFVLIAEASDTCRY